MKSFTERNHLVIGVVGVTVIAAIVVAALQYQNTPLAESEDDVLRVLR